MNQREIKEFLKGLPDFITNPRKEEYVRAIEIIIADKELLKQAAKILSKGSCSLSEVIILAMVPRGS